MHFASILRKTSTSSALQTCSGTPIYSCARLTSARLPAATASDFLLVPLSKMPRNNIPPIYGNSSARGISDQG